MHHPDEHISSIGGMPTVRRPTTIEQMSISGARRVLPQLAGWLGLIAFIGLIDYATGPDYGFGFFYLIPVIPAAWLLGRWPGVAVALASGLAWFAADFAARPSAPAIAVLWNASSRTFLFVASAVLVDSFHRERTRLGQIDEQRSLFLRVLEHELPRPGDELVRLLDRYQESGTAGPSELRALRDRAEELRFLSHDFVALGQIQAGTLALVRSRLDLNAAVQEIRAQLQDTDRRIPITLSNAALTVAADGNRLRQAIRSLIAEAAQASASDDVSLDLSDVGVHAQLVVTSGGGPYLAPHAEGEEPVGIALARLVVEAHGGTIELRRGAMSRGLRAVMRLPLAEAAPI